MSLYSATLALHSAVRWALLALGAVAAVRASHGWWRGRAWRRADELVAVAFVGATDLQLALGLALYLWLSPLPAALFTAGGAALGDPVLRFYALLHPAAMVAGFVVVHAGRARSKRAGDARARHRTVALAAWLWLGLVLVAIPWPWLAYGRPLARGWP